MKRELRRADRRIDFDHIRRIYGAMLPKIMATQHWVDPYFADWTTIFTPIESAMWSLIRSQATPFYPQFPVGRFFVDFGNPHRRVAIECDGKQWHDPERDRARDTELLDIGWTVVRFSGRSCLRLPYLPDVFNVPPLCRVDSFEPSLLEILQREQLIEDGEWRLEEAMQ